MLTLFSPFPPTIRKKKKKMRSPARAGSFYTKVEVKYLNPVSAACCPSTIKLKLCNPLKFCKYDKRTTVFFAGHNPTRRLYQEVSKLGGSSGSGQEVLGISRDESGRVKRLKKKIAGRDGLVTLTRLDPFNAPPT